MSTLIAPRASQLEARGLDRAFEAIIDQHVDQLRLHRYADEAKLLLKTYVAYSYLRAGTSVGMSTYRMKLCQLDQATNQLRPLEGRIKLALLGACNLLIPYLNSKTAWKDKLNQSLYQSLKLPWLNTDNLCSLTTLLNLLVFGLFLRNGRHLLLQHKILNLSCGIESADVAYSNAINKAQMEFMNREAIWRTIAEFSTTVLPFVNLNSIKEYIARPFRKSTPPTGDLSSRMFRTDSKQVCAICNSQPFNPFMIGCSHIFCYYCLQTRHQTNLNGDYSCPKCNFITQDSSQVIRYKIHNTLIKQQVGAI